MGQVSWDPEVQFSVSLFEVRIRPSGRSESQLHSRNQSWGLGGRLGERQQVTGPSLSCVFDVVFLGIGKEKEHSLSLVTELLNENSTN